MNEQPTHRPCQLLNAAVDPPRPVPARILCDLPPQRLIEIEETWFVARDHLATAMAAAQLHLESGHWDWRNKSEPEGVSDHRLFAIECDGEVQGLMALSASAHAAKLLLGEAVVYVDYLEA